MLRPDFKDLTRWLIAMSCASAVSVVGDVNGPAFSLAGEAAVESGTREVSGAVPASKDLAHPIGDATKGQVLYDASCIVCHGAGATGGIGPRLAGSPVLSNEKLFWDRVMKGRHMMPPLADALTAQQIADIQAWLKTLR